MAVFLPLTHRATIEGQTHGFRHDKTQNNFVIACPLEGLEPFSFGAAETSRMAFF